MSGLTSGKDDSKKKSKKNLEFEEIDWDNVNPDDFDSDDLDQIEANKEKKKGGPEIKFTSGFGEDVGKKLLKSKKSKEEEEKMTPFEKYQQKKREKKLAKKEAHKKKKEIQKKMAKMSETEVKELEKNRSKMTMLLGDEESDEENMEFKGDKTDSRFKDLINKNKEFALDPTHKDFHKIQGGAFVKSGVVAGQTGGPGKKQKKHKKQRTN